MKKNNPLSKLASKLGRIGGKKSVESRFKGKSKEEISEMMRDVRMKRIAQTLKESILEDPA